MFRHPFDYLVYGETEFDPAFAPTWDTPCRTALLGPKLEYLTDSMMSASKEEEQTLKPAYIERLKSCFHLYMRDALFRRLTFTWFGMYSDREAEMLANDGLYSCMLKRASRSRYRVACAFCDFTISNNEANALDFFQAVKIKLAHHKHCPYCNMVWPGGKHGTENVVFRDIHEELGFSVCRPGFYNIEVDKYDTVPLTLSNVTPQLESNHEGLRCLTCMMNRRDVMFSCGHVAICCECLPKLPTNDVWVRCPMCRKPINFLTRAILPHVPMLIDF